MTDQTADLLVRLKNAAAVHKNELVMPYSKMKEAILRIIEANGFVKNIKVVEEKSKKYIKVDLVEEKPLTHIKQISKPGHRIYTKSKDIKIPLRGLGLVIISTSTGLINAREAGKLGLGGEVICEIW